jgi:hypothetical protein
MRIGRNIIIPAIVTLGAAGSILAASPEPVTIVDGPVHVEITLSSVTIVDGPLHVQITLSPASPTTRYYLARG